MALRSVLTIAAAIGAEWLFVHATQAMLLPSGAAGLSAAEIHAQHHQILVIAMLLGATVGQITAFGVNDPDARGQLLGVLTVPAPLIVTLAFGLAVNDQRVLSLILLAVLIGLGTYLRRFGGRGFLTGIALFVGFLVGYFLHGAATTSDIGWLAAEIGVGVLVALAVRFGLFYPRRARDLQRTQRSYLARARKVVRGALAVLDRPEPSDGVLNRRLRGQLVRLNEAALMIDGQLAAPEALDPGSSAHRLHQRIFDAELAVTNLARFAQVIGGLALPPGHRAAARHALAALAADDLPAARQAADTLLTLTSAESDPPAVSAEPDDRAQENTATVLHRFAGTVLTLADALTDWVAAGRSDQQRGDQASFTSAVQLAGGWLLGSAVVSAKASMESGPNPCRRRSWIPLTPHARAAIQITVAAAAAIAAGDALSGPRFYWALITVYVAFMGANNVGEQINRAAFRLGGTLLGIVLGSLLAHAVGHHTNWAIALILGSLFLGLYLMRINYTFMAVAVTVTVAQLYVQLGEFSNALLVRRLEETAIGAAIAIIVALTVIPLHTRHAVRVAFRAHLQAAATLVGHATEQLTAAPASPAPGVRRDEATSALRHDARALDNAHQTLLATARPLRRSFYGELNEPLAEVISLAGAYHDYGRNLVTHLATPPRLDQQGRAGLDRAAGALRAGITHLLDAVDGPRTGTYVRSAALFDQVERHLPTAGGRAEDRLATATGRRAIRDLILIEEALAAIAASMSLAVTSYDTAIVEGDPEHGEPWTGPSPDTQTA
jgi:uncharacterized membrane protein YccC